MAKICFPHHTRGEFNSLNEAFCFLSRIDYGWSWYTLTKIVQYNIPYRDYLRNNGIDALVAAIIEEVPQLAADNASLNYLREWAANQKLAHYDIQCHNIKEKVTILGHTFNGLQDILMHTQLYAREGYGGLQCYAPSNIDKSDTVHIGKIYKNYPVFDSSDYSDDRTYRNYLFRHVPITESDIKALSQVPCSFNFCMVHENIPVNLLPILYYDGDGDYMLLAKNKG